MEHAEAIERARNAFRSGKTRDLVWRQNQLRALICLLDENMDRIGTVLRNDLNKVDVETEIEVTSVHNEAAEGLNKINKKFSKILIFSNWQFKVLDSTGIMSRWYVEYDGENDNQPRAKGMCVDYWTLEFSP